MRSLYGINSGVCSRDVCVGCTSVAQCVLESSGCCVLISWRTWRLLVCGQGGQMTTSGRLQHKQEVGCSPGLGRTGGHREPPRGRMEDDNLSPSMPPSPPASLHWLQGRAGHGGTGLGWPSVDRGAYMCVCVRVCECLSCSLNTAADQAQDPEDCQLASHSVSCSERYCSPVAAVLCCDSIVSSLVNFISPPPRPPTAPHPPAPPFHSRLPTEMWFMRSARRGGKTVVCTEICCVVASLKQVCSASFQRRYPLLTTKRGTQWI